MTSLLCGLAPLIKNPSYVYDAEHFFGFCLQLFPLAGPPLWVDCLALTGNMRQVSFPRTPGRIAVTNSAILKKECVDAFSLEVRKIYVRKIRIAVTNSKKKVR